MIDEGSLYNRALNALEIKIIAGIQLATDPTPTDGATISTTNTLLEWWQGSDVASVNGHHLYFSDKFADVNTSAAGADKGLTTDPNYYVSALVPGTTYYWRVDEVNDLHSKSPWKGMVWSFTLTDYLIVDDFEDYNNSDPDKIWQNWIDGMGYAFPPPGHLGNGTGSIVGYGNPPFAETRAVYIHGGAQSMPMDYNNVKTPFYSETEYEWDVAQDWTRKDVKSLTLWFRGIGTNTAKPLYVAVEDSAGKVKVVTHADANAVRSTTWKEWNIDLKEFSAGVDLTSIKTMYIGVGNRSSPTPGGTGTIYIDDIRLYVPRCIPSLAKPVGDFNNDCVVDYADLDVLAQQWLETAPPALSADLSGDNKVDLNDYALLAGMWLEEELWPQ
jgi:hypothetical protein